MCLAFSFPPSGSSNRGSISGDSIPVGECCCDPQACDLSSLRAGDTLTSGRAVYLPHKDYFNCNLKGCFNCNSARGCGTTTTPNGGGTEIDSETEVDAKTEIGRETEMDAVRTDLDGGGTEMDRGGTDVDGGRTHLDGGLKGRGGGDMAFEPDTFYFDVRDKQVC